MHNEKHRSPTGLNRNLLINCWIWFVHMCTVDYFDHVLRANFYCVSSSTASALLVISLMAHPIVCTIFGHTMFVKGKAVVSQTHRISVIQAKDCFSIKICYWNENGLIKLHLHWKFVQLVLLCDVKHKNQKSLIFWIRLFIYSILKIMFEFGSCQIDNQIL